MGRYSNKFVLCILVNGQVQKDLANGEVHIPFGSSYEVRVRNKNNRRAVVELYLDGENVGSFVVNANSHLDIKRWADKDVAFKFVDLNSSDAYDHGKQGPNPDKIKGTVEARFKLEKEKPKSPQVEHHHHHYPVYPPIVTLPITPQPWPVRRGWDLINEIPRRVTCDMPVYNSTLSVSSHCENAQVTCSVPISASNSSAACSIPSIPTSAPLLEGCTVEGNRTGQRWVNVDIDLEDAEPTVLQLFLKGYDPKYVNYAVPLQETASTNMPVVPPKTNMPHVVPGEPPQASPQQKTKFCVRCGQERSSESANFCGNCGEKFPQPV